MAFVPVFDLFLMQMKKDYLLYDIKLVTLSRLMPLMNKDQADSFMIEFEDIL